MVQSEIDSEKSSETWFWQNFLLPTNQNMCLGGVNNCLTPPPNFFLKSLENLEHFLYLYCLHTTSLSYSNFVWKNCTFWKNTNFIQCLNNNFRILRNFQQNFDMDTENSFWGWYDDGKTFFFHFKTFFVSWRMSRNTMMNIRWILLNKKNFD